jgi:Rab proteins geranylgeranyltransferase component A
MMISVASFDKASTSALSKAGHKVLHLDHHNYYGAEDASLTIEETVSWANEYRATELPAGHSRFTSISYSFPAFPEHTSELGLLPEPLKRVSRQYTLSLSPSLIPSTGPLITALIKSGVARHSAFRLLEAIALYSEGPPDSAVTASATFIKVPATKQDVFTDKDMSLPDKRRLMKFLMFAAAGKFSGTPELQGSSVDDMLCLGAL